MKLSGSANKSGIRKLRVTNITIVMTIPRTSFTV